jgi:uncharacterized protein YutE (UPF0331/DUF86 family)
VVDFRDLIVREYSRIEMRRVFEGVQNVIEDVPEYPFAVLRKFGLPG